MVFATHWHESALDLHVFPFPIPPPPSLSIPSLSIPSLSIPSLWETNAFILVNWTMRYWLRETRTYMFLINLERISSMKIGTRQFCIQILALPLIKGVTLNISFNLCSMFFLYKMEIIRWPSWIVCKSYISVPRINWAFKNNNLYTLRFWFQFSLKSYDNCGISVLFFMWWLHGIRCLQQKIF